MWQRWRNEWNCAKQCETCEKICKEDFYLASGLVRGDHAEWKLLNSLLRYKKACCFTFSQWNFHTHDEIIWWKITALFTLSLDFNIFLLLHFSPLFYFIKMQHVYDGEAIEACNEIFIHFNWQLFLVYFFHDLLCGF